MARRVGSIVRDRLKEMLYVVGELTAYDAYKHYIVIFGKISQRNIYYQFEKGTELAEFVVAKVEEEKGDYSWGTSTTKKYYRLGPASTPVLNEAVRNYFSSLKSRKSL